MAAGHGEQQKGWWSRNWFWALPGGCLGCFGLMIGSCALFLGGLFTAVRTSQEFQDVLARIQSHPEVVAAIGEPIEAGWIFQGTIDVSDSTKTVDMSVPISGPNGVGTLYVEGEETSGVWTFERLEVELDNGDWIDLLEQPGESTGPVTILGADRERARIRASLVRSVRVRRPVSAARGPVLRPTWIRSTALAFG